MQLASGMLLVATPALQDPNFVDTVVLLLDVTEEGALGVVLNRPSQVLVADVLGWGAGQLDGEVERQDWYVVTSEADDPFRDDPEGLRRDVMRRQPGMLAWHVNRPVDPDLN